MSKTKLGQHFLIDASVAQRQIQYAQLSRNDSVLEVGPGKGMLTRFLADEAGHVFAVEKDKKLFQMLKNTLPSNVTLIHHDILDIDIYQPGPLLFNKVVSNLPYQISSPFTFWLLNESFDRAVLMYQKEFAQRMVASAGSKNYSRLSVAIYYFAHCKILETVSRNCFHPRPQIDSCIVELIPKDQQPFHLIDESFFFELIKNLFNHRRKQIKTTIEQIYHHCIDDLLIATERVEKLSPEQIAELSNVLRKRLSKDEELR
ncbi:MAG: 16S rRNA (adenine(1518)-N(6)/adenine(1519)-N(6))-dimethyltransferase RsmA [Thermoplasmatota archaeon]